MLHRKRIIFNVFFYILVPLLHVLAINSKILQSASYTGLWSQLTGVHVASTTVSIYENDVPLLIRDMVSLLLQLVLTLPLHINIGK